MSHAARRKSELKREGYGRVVVLAQKKPPDGPACEKCRNLAIEPTLRRANCTAGRDLEPSGCLDFKDASRDSMSTYNYDYDGRMRR